MQPPSRVPPGVRLLPGARSDAAVVVVVFLFPLFFHVGCCRSLLVALGWPELELELELELAVCWPVVSTAAAAAAAARSMIDR